MDRLEFLVRYLEIGATFLTTTLSAVLSWPVAFVVALVVFKKPVEALIARIRRVKTPAGDLLLQEELREIEAEIADDVSPTPAAEEPTDDANEVDAPREQATASSDATNPPEGAASFEKNAPPAVSDPYVTHTRMKLTLTDAEASKVRRLVDGLKKNSSDYDPPAVLLADPDHTVTVGWDMLLESLVRAIKTVEHVDAGKLPFARLVDRVLALGVVTEEWADSARAVSRLRIEILESEVVTSATARAFFRTCARLTARLDRAVDFGVSAQNE